MKKAIMLKNVPYEINNSVGSLLGKDWQYECIGEFKHDVTGVEMVALRKGNQYMAVVTEKKNVRIID